MSEQKQPNAGIWSVVIIGALALYPVSLGPSCWLSSRFGGEQIVNVAYRPVTWTCETTNSAMLENGVNRYAGLGARENWYWLRLVTSNPGEPERAEWEWTETAPLPMHMF